MNHRRFVIAAGVVLGRESGNALLVSMSELVRVISRRLGDGADEILSSLRDEGVLDIVKHGRGHSVVIKMTPEVVGVYRQILGDVEVDMSTFVDILNSAIAEEANPVTRYTDLGRVRDRVCERLGIDYYTFDRLLLRALSKMRHKYVLAYGGTYRIRVGSQYFGLIKVVS